MNTTTMFAATAALAALLFAAPSALAAGPAADSAPFLLDTMPSPRIAADGEAIPLAYSPRWGGAASCSITADGARVLSNATDDGTHSWTPRGTGRHALSFEAGATRCEAAFTVLGDDVVLHGGVLAAGETWGADKTHLVTAPLTVPSGVTLTIEAGAVVKFMDGASLTVASGGACIARGVIFTHVADDTAGGDTMMDGDGGDGSPGTARPTMGAYAITGSITDDDSTEYRYLPPQTLTSSITSDTRLRGHRCYIVSNSVTVASGATLTLQPGTVLKFNTGCQLTVNGTLDARGTRAAPIVFTSLKDDEHGGDTNGDGEKTQAGGGDWNGVWVNGRANLACTELMYSGNGNERGIIQTQNSGVLTMTGCTVAHALNDGIWNWGGSISVTNTVFIDLGWATAPYRGTKNEYVNCVFYGNDVALCYWSHWTGAPTYRNCVFANCAHGWCELASGSYGDPPSGVTVANSCFFNPEGYRQQSTAFDGKNGNIYADPLFLDPENGDFRIAANSPCVDAADSSAAPELDFYGQPRTTVRPAPTGTPDALGRHADIGLHEYHPDNAPGPYDLAAVSVSASAAAAEPGGTLAVSWTVRNAGKRAVPDAWHDALALVSVATGRAYALGEPLNEGALAVGASRESSATFAVPVVPAGDYRLRLSVNSRRADVAEGSSTGNNAVLSEGVVSVALAATLASDGVSGSVARGASSVTAFSIPANAGDLLLRVAAPAGGSSLSGRCGLGFLPVEGGSGAALVFAGGEAWVSVPAGTETVYLVLENAGAAAASFTADFRAGSLSVASVAPASLPASGTVTLEIAGAGFADGCTVTLGGSSAAVQAVRCVSASLLAVRVDCAKLAAGSRPALAVRKGAETKTLANALTVTSAAGKGKFWAKLSVPESVREGRLVSTCFVEYGNSGTADVLAPVLQVAMDGNGTLGYVDGLSGLKTLQFVAAGDEGSAGVLRPGASHRIRFALRAGSRNAISLHTSEGSTYAPAPWTSAATYLADLSAATTRIGLRGQDPTDYALVLDLAKAMKKGEPTSAIYGRIVDEDGAGISGAVVNITNATTAVSCFSGDDGRFCSPRVSDGTFGIRLSQVVPDFGVLEAVVYGDDANLGNLSAQLGGSIKVRLSDAGSNDVLVWCVAENGDVLAPERDDEAGYLVFSCIPAGSVEVVCTSEDGTRKTSVVHVSNGKTRMVEFSFARTGSLLIDFEKLGLPVPAGFMIYDGAALERIVILHDDTTYNLNGVAPGSYFLVPFSSDAIVDDPVVLEVPVVRDSTSSSRSKALSSSTVRGMTPYEAIRIEYGFAGSPAFNTLRERAKTLLSVDLFPPEGVFDCEHNWSLYAKQVELKARFAKEYSEFNRIAVVYEKSFENKNEIVSENIRGLAVDVVSVFFKLAEKTVRIAKKADTVWTIFSRGYAGYEALSDGDMSWADWITGATVFVANDAEMLKALGAIGLEAADFTGWIETAWSIATHAGGLSAGMVATPTGEDEAEAAFNLFLHQTESYDDTLSWTYDTCCANIGIPTSTLPKVDAVLPSVPQSCDPNEMGGPLGFDASRALLPGETYEWTIYFENQTNATAAASEVRVDVQLSAQLDWSTFETVAVSFGNQTDMGLEGKANGTSECAVPGTNYTVHSEVALDASGVVSWYLRIVDPDGDEEGYPLDSTGGFLPPNDETHRGEGSITYRVAVRKNATQGARIDASADIRFDNNPIIVTDPAWWNTVATVYKPTVDLGDGTTANLVLVVGQPYGALPTPKARAGCTFAGWFTGPNGTGRKVTAESIVRVGDRGLYAYWMPTAFTVKFDANGGKGKMAAQKVAPGKSAKLSANKFTKSGCVFLGWAKSKKGPVAYANAASVKNLAAAGKTVTLYAKWAKKNYKVAFYANGGKGKMAAQKMTYGKAKKLSKNKFKAPKGKKFAGWAKSKADAKKGNVAYKNKKAVKNLVLTGRTVKLYAVWKKK